MVELAFIMLRKLVRRFDVRGVLDQLLETATCSPSGEAIAP
jgi:hypothetical protein